MLLERRILLGGGSVPVLVQIGQDAQMVPSAAREFGRELAIFLAILWLALSLADWAQVALGLGPLARVQTALDRRRRVPRERLAAEEPRHTSCVGRGGQYVQVSEVHVT